MSKTPSSTSASSTSKRLRAGKENVRTTRWSRSNEEELPDEEQLRLLEGADAEDPVEEEKDSGRKRVSAKVPPKARGRPRKVRPAAEVVAMAPETGEKEKVQRPAEKDIDQQQSSSERAMTQQESAKEAVTQDEKEMAPLEDGKKIDGSAPDNEGPSVASQASAGNVRASGQQDEDDKDSDSAASAAAVELEEDDNEDDDGGFDINEGDEITVLSNGNGAAVEFKRGDAGATQGPDEVRKEDDEQLQPAQDQENPELLHVESSTSATIARKSSRVSSTASDNGSTANMDTHTKASSTSKRELDEQPDPELPTQQAQKNTSKEKKKKKQKTIAKISPASSRNLFQFTCKLLESQRLEYEVRAREFEEKNAVLAAKRAKWEKKIRSVKRQLRGYGHPVDGVYDGANSSAANGSIFNRSNSSANPDWGTSTALTTTSDGSTNMNSSSSGSSTNLITMCDAFSSRTSFPSGVGGPDGVDSLLPASIQSIEAQIRDTLGSRANLVNGMIKELQTMRGLNDKITRLR